MKTKKLVAIVLSLVLILSVALCGCSKSQMTKFDNEKWLFDANTNVYYQTGIVYCSDPANAKVQNLSVFVPAAYMTGAINPDGTYVCRINPTGQIGRYTAQNAPVVLPVETLGYNEQTPYATISSEIRDYTDRGLVYVRIGARGKEAGAPAGAADFKAGIKYLRDNSDSVAGSMDRIFAFGLGEGANIASILGATGDCEMYKGYLDAIGAVKNQSDAIAGVMCWCPSSNLDSADAAYEWNMGITRKGLSEKDQSLSDALALEYAKYINSIKLIGEDNEPLTLKESKKGIYQAGSYYDFVLQMVENSLNKFLDTVTFPYTIKKDEVVEYKDTQSSSESKGIEQSLDDEDVPDNTNIFYDFQNQADIYSKDGVKRGKSTSKLNMVGTYNTVEDYIDALNKNVKWVKYDKLTNTATITSLADFVTQLKGADKGLGAFDSMDITQSENMLFATNEKGAHFSDMLAKAKAASGKSSETITIDNKTKDDQDMTIVDRANMYNPMYFISDYYEGYDTTVVAQYWRIRSGVRQSDTALCSEINLALALRSYGVYVDYDTVWDKGHIMAESEGTPANNVANWIYACVTAQ